MEVVGYGMSKKCADLVFRDARFAPGEGRDEVGVVELHDCFAANEVRDLSVSVWRTWYKRVFLCFQLITYPALGLCAPDEAHKLVERGDNTVRAAFLCSVCNVQLSCFSMAGST
jgi:sterol carrier protein 2